MLLASTYKCVICKYEYKHKSSLSRHMKVCESIDNNFDKITHHTQKSTNDNKMITNDNKMVTNDNKMVTNDNKMVTNDNKKKKKIECKYCHKIYKYTSGLSRHMQKCTKKSEYASKHKEHMSLNTSNSVQQTTANGDTGVQNLLMKCFDMMTEQTQMMNKLIPNIGNYNNNTTNNKFNLNVYLNETCKDAINLPEFISNITLQLADLMSARKDGLLSSTTNVFLKKLQSTEPVHRPIQCTDVKRKTMYIKEAGEWSKDIGNEKLKKAMSSISQKHTHLISDWKQNNPKHMESDDGQIEFVKVIQSATKDIKNDTRRLQSAVKEIGESAHVTPSIE